MLMLDTPPPNMKKKSLGLPRELYTMVLGLFCITCTDIAYVLYYLC